MAFAYEPLPRVSGEDRKILVWSDGKCLGEVAWSRVPRIGTKGRGTNRFVFAWTFQGCRFRTREEAAECALVEFLSSRRPTT